MAYFKKLIFEQTNATLIFHKLKIVKGQFVDDGLETLDLKSNSGIMQCLEIKKEATAAGTTYSYSFNSTTTEDSLYLFQTGFGFIDSNAPTAANLFPICFGKFLEIGTVSLEEIICPPGLPLRSISGQQGKFGCFVGETDIAELPPMPPMVVVLEDIKFYIGLEEKTTIETKTYYDLKIQRAANSPT